MVLHWSMRTPGSMVLGPGGPRTVLWTHGCNRSCPGCVAEHLREGEGFASSTDELAAWVLSKGTRGLTISGGEPFLQADAVAELIACLRARKPDLSVIVYTGFTMEELAQDSRAQRLLGLVDLLIDGPYLQDSNDDGRFAVGSSNQRVIRLSDRFTQEEVDRYYQQNGRKVEFHEQDGMLQLVGVPNADELALWRYLRKAYKEVTP